MAAFCRLCFATRVCSDQIMMQLAIVGCGAVVEELYLPALKKVQRSGYMRVASLVDTKVERLQRLGRAFPKAECYESLQEAYHSKKIDLTLITSPPAFHANGAEIAFAHGSHVLCEKPLASSLQEAEQMTAQAERQGCLLAVGFTRRFFPNLCKARQLIEADVLGGPLHFIMREGKVYNWPVASDAPFRRATGGGVLLDVGAHAMDTLCWLFGQPVIRSFKDDALTSGVDANCIAELEFSNASGTLQLSWDQPLASGLTIRGTKAQLGIPAWGMHAWEWREVNASWEKHVSDATFVDDLRTPAERFRRPEDFYDCIRFQLIQVLRAVKYSEPLPVSGRAALLSMRALQQCQAIAEPLEQEWLTPSEQRAFRCAHWRSAGVFQHEP